MEVLAAMVLIGVVLPVAMKGVSVALQSAARARHLHEASLLAERVLNEALATGDAAALGNAGTFDDFPEYRWELATAAADFGCEAVTVTVSWPSRGMERSFALTTLLRPADALSVGGVP